MNVERVRAVLVVGLFKIWELDELRLHQGEKLCSGKDRV